MRMLVTGLALTLLSGCSLHRVATRSAAAVIERGLPAVYKGKDLQFAKEALPANLELMEILIENDPRNAELLTVAAEGFCGYAFMFLEGENDARASAFYEKGGAYALRALTVLKAATAERVVPERIQRRSVPAAFWHTFARAGFIGLNQDNTDALAELPRILPVAERIRSVEPGYYHNGASALLGTYHAMRPKVMGGDLGKAKKHFDEALQGAGAEFLLNQYLLAKVYAVAAQDSELFARTLSNILAAEPRDDASRLANESAKAKAAQLLQKKGELF